MLLAANARKHPRSDPLTDPSSLTQINSDEPVKKPILDGFEKTPRSRLANPEE
jgi:hypothetical protein